MEFYHEWMNYVCVHLYVGQSIGLYRQKGIIRMILCLQRL